MNIDKTKQKHISLLIQNSLDAVSKEASALFAGLDSISADIRQIESSLKKIGANFPFMFEIAETNVSEPKTPEDRHLRDSSRTIDFYITKTVHYLAWVGDDETNEHRLFYVTLDTEEVGCSGIGECCQYIEALGPVVVRIKRPFIESTINTRLQYYHYLIPFLEAFQKHLNSLRNDFEGQLSRKDEF